MRSPESTMRSCYVWGAIVRQHCYEVQFPCIQPHVQARNSGVENSCLHHLAKSVQLAAELPHGNYHVVLNSVFRDAEDFGYLLVSQVLKAA